MVWVSQRQSFQQYYIVWVFKKNLKKDLTNNNINVIINTERKREVNNNNKARHQRKNRTFEQSNLLHNDARQNICQRLGTSSKV